MSRPTTIGAAMVFLLITSLPLLGGEASQGFLGYQDGFESAVLRYQANRPAPGAPALGLDLAAGEGVVTEVEARAGAVRGSVSAGTLWVLDQLSRALASERISRRLGCFGAYAAVLLPATRQNISAAPSFAELSRHQPEHCQPSAAASPDQLRDLARAQWQAGLGYLFRYLEGLAATAPGEGRWRNAADAGSRPSPEHAAAAHTWALERGRGDAQTPALVLLAALGGAWPLDQLADAGRIGLAQDLGQRLVQPGVFAAAPLAAAEPKPAGIDWVRVLATLLVLATAGLAWSVYSLYQHRRLREYYEQSFYETRDSLDVIATALGQHRFVNIMRLAWQQSAQTTSDDT